MRASRQPRIALGPFEIAGYYANLAAGFEQLGIDATLLMIAPHAFRYAAKPPRSRLARFVLERAQATYPGSRSGLAKIRVLPANLLWRSLLVAHALASYDVFIFSCGDTLLDGMELPLLKLLRRKVVFVFHGSDSRPPYINGKNVRRAGDDPGKALVRKARQMKRRLAHVRRHADAIIDSPLSGHFHDRPFVNWFRIGIPYAAAPTEVDAGATDADAVRGRPRRVVHAPSDPISKGSLLIEQAVERANQRGLNIELIQLKGRPNAEVLSELARCDFVIDELYSDVPGAGLAFEAASFGRPTIVAGYAASEFRRWIQPDMALPTHYCRPEELDHAIDKLACDEDYRAALGSRARQFLRDKCAPAAVAERVLRVLQARDVDDWYVDPQQITYVFGTGLTEAAARKAIRAVIDAAGERGLQLPGRFELVRRLEAFAKGRPPPP
jgi:hypothetical protein